MSIHVVIDGYNLLGSGRHWSSDIEKERDSLIKSLVAYKKVKRARLTVVFDGTSSGRLARGREVIAGIEVVYSKDGEKADDVLKEMARTKGEGLTLVTSDREVALYAQDRGAVVVTAGEFSELLDMAVYEDMKGVKPGDDEDNAREKKGPSRRPPKDERKKLRRLKKL